jgi:Na+/melibiose symporter-like transporter
MLDVKFFKNPRFTAASTGITLIFFAMFGMTFLLTQYFQFVLGYSPLATGLRFLPWAAVVMIGSPLSARLVDRIGTKIVVTLGLTLATAGLAALSTLQVDSHYWPDVLWRMMLMAAGMSLTMAPATDSIMSSLPLSKAGVGSAVNDTTREVGGALGIAVFGTIANAAYRSGVDFSGLELPPAVGEAASESVGAATGVAAQVGGPIGTTLVERAASAFTDAFNVAATVAVLILVAGALAVLRTFSRTREQEAIANADIDAEAAALEVELATSVAGAD